MLFLQKKRDQLLEYCHKKNIEVKILSNSSLSTGGIKILVISKGCFASYRLSFKEYSFSCSDQLILTKKEEQNYVKKNF